MQTKQELIEDILSLPVEDRAYIIDSLKTSLNPINTDIDSKWIEIFGKRLKELQKDEIKVSPGEDVFDKIWERFQNEVHFSFYNLQTFSYKNSGAISAPFGQHKV
jgi:hypothetical protein